MLSLAAKRPVLERSEGVEIELPPGSENGYLVIVPCYSEGKAQVVCRLADITITFLSEYEAVENHAKYILAYMGWWRTCRILIEVLKEIVEKNKKEQEIAEAVAEVERIVGKPL